MQTDTVSMRQFVTDNRITMTAERVDRNPNMDSSNDMDHWKCVFTRRTSELRCGYDTFHGYKGKLGDIQYRVSRMTTYFSMGYGHKGKEPEPAEVLDCLASDSYATDTPFSEWAIDMGYDPDSRKAEKIHKTCVHQAKRLQAFLGDSLYDALLYNTERM